MIFRKAALDRLSSPEQLDSLLQITSPRSWLAFVGLASLLAATLVWATVATIPITMTAPSVIIEQADSTTATARFFVSAEQSRQLAVGMPVSLASQTGSEQQLSGTIMTIGAAPASTELLTATPNRDYLLADGRVLAGIPIVVDVRLVDSLVTLPTGALATATVTLGHARPIEMVIPLN